MARVLLIVSRAQPTRYPYLRHVFASDTVDVTVDRRTGERRQRRERVAVDRRRADRRQHDISKELETQGWVLVRH